MIKITIETDTVAELESILESFKSKEERMKINRTLESNKKEIERLEDIKNGIILANEEWKKRVFELKQELRKAKNIEDSIEEKLPY